ncbi:MAG: alpha/beta fold hydrolase [Akkermansiaceae bacterium]|nr:alpha/beta fold hydrolase [Akkermansiaceae bacterium]
MKGLPRFADKHYISYDGDTFGYRKWLPTSAPGKDPAVVIVGVHGISGHSGDYENMAKQLLKQHDDVALYAAETRGQGMDEKVFRRGDIHQAREWYKDLYTFTRLVRKAHPNSKIVWFGESMGSLIVMHAYSNTPTGEQQPDAMVIASPIVEVEAKLPFWKLLAVRISSLLLPKLRVSLETLSEGRKAVVTEDDIHEQQAAKNPWYIPRYTLRLLLVLGDMAAKMDHRASLVKCPILVLHGGKDIFTQEKDVNDFFDHFPTTTRKTKKYYPGSYHLLMYDHDRDKIFKDVSQWLKQAWQVKHPASE